MFGACGRRGSRYRSGRLAALSAVLWPLLSHATGSPTLDDLDRLSLEELGRIEVTSASKVAEPIDRAPVPIYVISRDEILRSGATTLWEAVRLAPNLGITQYTATDFALTARGLGGSPTAQNFSNKILLLIDGRSVYSPLFSGIYLDVQDVVLADVDRIEVISGPGATLWGANAVNGVINVIMRPAYRTSGGFAEGMAGNDLQSATVRYGGSLGDETAYRIYANAFDRASEELNPGVSALDRWSKAQTGFRIDRSVGAAELTVEGDAYRGLELQGAAGYQLVAGGNGLARWRKHTERSDVEAQFYVDQTEREAPNGGGGFVLHTYDFQFQQSVLIGDDHRLVWGADERLNSYWIQNSAQLLFMPRNRTLGLTSVFGQDTMSVTPSIDVTLGLKAEKNAFSEWALHPDVRLAWRASESAFVWASASRALRSPTPFDHDVVEKLGTVVYLTGNTDFRPERLTAYQAGMRARYAPNVSYSVSLFYNDYADLRTIEPSASPALIPFYWGNLMSGSTYGLEAWADWQVTAEWRLSPGIRTLAKRLRFDPGSSGLLGVGQAGDDPTSQAQLKSSLDLGRSFTFDAVARYVGALPNPALPAYCEMNARLGWRVSPRLEAGVSGTNLLHSTHREFPAPYGEEIGRSVLAHIRWTF